MGRLGEPSISERLRIICGAWVAGVVTDAIAEAVDRLRAVAPEVGATIEAALAVLDAFEEARGAGLPLVQVVARMTGEGGRTSRRDAAAAINAYENAVMRFRSAVVRALVDETHMTLTSVAGLLEISRPMAARLYRASGRSTNS